MLGAVFLRRGWISPFASCPTVRAPDGDLTGRKAATIYTAVYGEEHQRIGYFGDERDQGALRSERFKNVPVACSMANTYAVWAACLEGLGLAELPWFLAEPALSRRTAPEPWGDIWVLVHPDPRRSPPLKVVRDELVDALKKLQPRLRGRAWSANCPMRASIRSCSRPTIMMRPVMA